MSQPHGNYNITPTAAAVPLISKIVKNNGKAAYFAVIAAPCEIYYGQKERWMKYV